MEICRIVQLNTLDQHHGKIGKIVGMHSEWNAKVEVNGEIVVVNKFSLRIKHEQSTARVNHTN